MGFFSFYSVHLSIGSHSQSLWTNCLLSAKVPWDSLWSTGKRKSQAWSQAVGFSCLTCKVGGWPSISEWPSVSGPSTSALSQLTAGPWITVYQTEELWAAPGAGSDYKQVCSFVFHSVNKRFVSTHKWLGSLQQCSPSHWGTLCEFLLLAYRKFLFYQRLTFRDQGVIFRCPLGKQV